MNDLIKICKIIPDSIVDGLGFRYVIFTQGCKHDCRGCFNPSTHDFNSGVSISSDEILNDLESNLELIKGITLSGGDPFEQSEALVPLVKEIKNKFPQLDIWAYSGYTIDLLINDNNKYLLLKEIDVLVDGKFDIELKDVRLKFKGSTNQRIIDVKKTLETNEIQLYKLE